ncbi:gypsy type transposase [Tanacetum coccineum]
MPEYLRKPDFNDIQKLYTAHNNIHGFLGMLESIDCMLWEWKNYPKSWHGQFARGDKKYPTIMLEAVASYDLWIWHAFFGVTGANNDLTVLNNSPLYDNLLDSIALVAPFECNGVAFEKGYYLADGIYPQWSSFVKSFTIANSEKNALFKWKQESACKDIERAFGVLQGYVALERETDGDLIRGDRGQGLGIRHGVIDGAISISAVQNVPLWGIRVPLFIDANSLPRTSAGAWKICHVRLASSASPNAELEFSAKSIICLVGPGAHYNDMAQTQRPDIKSTLTLKALKNFCDTYHIPDEVHPQIPTPNQTIHEMPAGKIGVYTRFFEYANFRLPLSTFLVNVLKHYRIHISQLSVISAAKKWTYLRSYVLPIQQRSGLVRGSMVKMNQNCYYTIPLLLVAPARVQSELDASVDRLFDEEGSGNEEEPHDSANGDQGAGTLIVSEATEVVAEDVIPLRPRQKKRKTIVDAGEPSHLAKKLRDDHGAPSGPSVAGKSRSAVQRLFAGTILNAEVRGGPVSTLPFVTSLVSATPEREDEHLADSVTGLNLRTICAPQRFVISSDSSHHSGANIAEAEVDSIARSAAPIIATVVTATADVATTTKEAPAKEAPAKPSLFAAGSSSAGGTDPAPGGFSDVSGSDFLVGGIRTVVDPEFDLQKVYVPQWSVTNGSCLDDGRVCREMLDEFAPPKFFASIRGMEHDQLFTEFNVGTARQISLSAEVRMRAEYNIKEKRRLKAVVEEKDMLLKTKGEEIDSLSAQLHLKEAEAAEAIHLRAEASRFGVVEKSLRDEVKYLRERNAALEEEKGILNVKVSDLTATVKVREQEAADSNALVIAVHALEASSARLQEKVMAYEKFVDQLEKFQDDKIKEVNDKLEKLDADVVAMVLHLEEKFYPHLLNTITGRQWLLTHGMEVAIAKCLNYTEYLSALGVAIGKAIEKGMQEGLSAGITHGIEGRTLTDIAAYNPFAETDYLSALHHLQSVNFSLLAELKSNKDASTETIMNLLRLEDHLADRLGLTASQPRIDQLMVPIHHSPDHRVIRASALSLSLDPLSVMDLIGTEGTSAIVVVPARTTTALSITFASASVVRPISTDDYEVVQVDGQRGGGTEDQIGGNNVDPFPSVDDVDLNLQ